MKYVAVLLASVLLATPCLAAPIKDHSEPEYLGILECDGPQVTRGDLGFDVTLICSQGKETKIYWYSCGTKVTFYYLHNLREWREVWVVTATIRYAFSTHELYCFYTNRPTEDEYMPDIEAWFATK